jgi:hypothetical protein
LFPNGWIFHRTEWLLTIFAKTLNDVSVSSKSSAGVSTVQSAVEASKPESDSSTDDDDFITDKSASESSSVKESILQNSVSAQNFTDKLLS